MDDAFGVQGHLTLPNSRCLTTLTGMCFTQASAISMCIAQYGKWQVVCKSE